MEFFFICWHPLGYIFYRVFKSVHPLGASFTEFFYFQICREKTGEAYWERRKKNNEAAKRSRDARRAKEDEVHCSTVLKDVNIVVNLA